MTGFILAAGFGKRMQHYTENMPKPLLPVGGYPLIYYSLFFLWRYNIHQVIVNLHYLAEQLEEELLALKGFDFALSFEPEILGTAGGLRKALVEKQSESTVVLINPDVILWPEETDRPRLLHPGELSALYLKMRPSGSKERGFAFTSDHQIENRADGEYYYVGYGMVKPRLFRTIPADEFVDLGKLWAAKSKLGFISGQRYQGELVSAGNLTDYEVIKDRDIIPQNLKTEWQEFLQFIGKT